MRTEYLEEFVKWAESNTVGDAAREFCVSQSTLSKHLLSLEKELGVELINHGSTNRLTPAGIMFYNEVRDILRQMDDLVEKCKDLQCSSSQEITVWSSHILSGAMFKLDELLRAFKRENSDVYFTMYNESYTASVDALRAGRTDVALEYRAGNAAGHPKVFTEEGLEYCFLMEEPVLLWLHKDNPLATKSPLMPSDLRGVPVMCSLAQHHPLMGAIKDMCGQRSFYLRQYYFNPTSQSAFFFEAPDECVYLFTPGLQDDRRIKLRDEMVLRSFDDDTFVVRSYIVMKADCDSEPLGRLRTFLRENA